MSGDKMYMSGSNPYENNFLSEIITLNIVQNHVYSIFQTNQISLKTATI